jgi:uncharacterized damage-inducible protein DinB
MPSRERPPDSQSALREQLTYLLQGGNAHLSFSDALGHLPLEKAGLRPPGAPHSVWELLEHMRIAQEDILRFSQTAEYVSPKWPEGYWPPSTAPAGAKDWKHAIRCFEDDLAEFVAMVLDPEQDLYHVFPWGDGQNLLREALVLADHNSYHLGQIVLVRQLLGAWRA